MTQIADDALALDITRRFAAPPHKVFDAWLSPRWAQWLPPRDVSCEMVVMEPRVGGRYLARMSMPDGRTVNIQGEYLEISRPERLVMTWRRESDAQETTITLQFRATGDGTVMTLRHDGFAELELCARHNSGWAGQGGSLDKLAEILTAEG